LRRRGGDSAGVSRARRRPLPHLSGGGLQAIAAVGLMFVLFPVLLTSTARAIARVEDRDES
jgi:hypothetical protein